MTGDWMGPTERVRRSRLRWSLPVAVLLALLLPATALAADTTITTGPADGATIADATPDFTFSSDDDPAATFECRVDTDLFGPARTPASYTTEALS